MTMKLYDKTSKQLMALRVLELSAKGHSYRDIHEEMTRQGMPISVGKVETILYGLNESAKENLKNVLPSRIALEFEKSILLSEFLLKRCIEIEASSHDDRVRLQAISQANAISNSKNELLSSSQLISRAISKVVVVQPLQPEEVPAEEEGQGQPSQADEPEKEKEI